MVRQRKPWEGTNWIKQCTLPKVLQIMDNGQVLNDLDQMFSKMHNHFAQSAATPAESDFVNVLPQHSICLWPPFSELELMDALGTCSNASAPSPSHFSWELLKLFLKDDHFRSFFLHLANDIVASETWPDSFK